MSGSGITCIGIMVCVALGSFFAFHTISANPGEEIVLVDKPYMFGEGGVRAEPLKEGRGWFFASTEGIPVSIVPNSTSVSFNDFTSKDNILLDFESTVQTRIINPTQLVDKFGSNWFNNNLRAQYTALVRNKVKDYNMSEMMSDNNVSKEIDSYLTKEIRELVKENNIPIEVISISLGRAKPNPEVLQQINKTAAEQQRYKTLEAAIRSEGKREEEQKAKAKADNAYRENLGLTPEQYVDLEKSKMFSEACEKSKACIITTPTASPIINVPAETPAFNKNIKN